jgi:thiamine-phosphate pyrophosphorylase
MMYVMRGFYYVTDRKLSGRQPADEVGLAIEGGAAMVQYRDKDAPIEERTSTARRLRLQCSGRAIFIVNDDIEVAAACDADGVHIGQDDVSLKTARYLLGNDKLIGVSVHSVEQAIAADEGGADYVAVCPVFATPTKGDAGAPVGLQMIRDVKAHVKMPVCAIGGIDRGNVDSVLEAGADMVCAISATSGAPDIKAAVRYFASKWKR